MDYLPKKLQKKLEERTVNKSIRSLGTPNDLVDFSSNDYLGFSTSETIFNRASEILEEHNLTVNGATGSRLLSGNHSLYTVTENCISTFHKTDSALIFNSGYDANVGFFSSVPQRGDIIFYDELCHASIRDGIKLSDAKAYKFTHNNVEGLKEKHNSTPKGTEVYVVTESIFSMDGDQADLISLVQFCDENQCHLVVDEAHALGVFGEKGEGLVQQLGLEDQIFARLVTFGKGLGSHGAAILGSQQLISYLINFARSFIYTTALPPHTLATIWAAYQELANCDKHRNKLYSNIAILQNMIIDTKLEEHFISSHSAIQSCVVSGNENVKKISQALQNEGFNVKPILSPTVPIGKERLRICVHSFNTEHEIYALLQTLKIHLS
ncbi:pyridoxal phosphate-dependent aminotransferase family protein [Rasiella rasia]|uniref:Pyridoxal phosphate-dependent aminotransferase family protein n=1 Tax=Rasiella rasia TaxID=2744027 RepID=A0A6G6GM42_9FLAO|nr:pyridoxal phosphate-dependent aminotransferase family protein [Rasiella rasia]QIE59560.1 pyridoxal phosphate-dependent aminotransferase family protein [Rasiella rasia]